MNITTIPVPNKPAHLMLDCENSTAVSRIAIIPNFDGDNSFVLVNFRSGDEWGYKVATNIMLVGLGEKSAGRFVATVIKPNAITSNHLNREAVRV